MARITDENIAQIIVFGSNSEGHHAGGAAAHALQFHGANWGQGHGIQGWSYAIDTMSGFDELRENAWRILGILGVQQERPAAPKPLAEDDTFLRLQAKATKGSKK